MEHATIKTFRDLEAWKQAHALAVFTYGLTKTYPKEEMFGIVNQMRRAAVSVPSNLAEGFSRQSLKEKIQFYAVALGSLTELQSQLLISRDIEYLSASKYEEVETRTISTHKLINGLIKRTRTFLLLFLILHSSFLLPIQI